MREQGISPPPRPDSGLSDLVAKKLSVFAGYAEDLDKWFRRLHAAVPKVETYAPTLDPASVAANTIAEQTFTVTGLNTADIVIVNKPSDTAGIGIVGARVSAANTLAIRFYNSTGSPIDPASEEYVVVAIRR